MSTIFRRLRRWNPSRTYMLFGVGAGFLALVAITFAVARAVPTATLVVTHWANVDVMGPDMLPAMAKRFNAEDHRTAAGKRIEVHPFLVDSGVITEEVVSLATTARLSGPCLQAAGGCPTGLENPTIVTPAAEHWFTQMNYRAGRTVVDASPALNLATTYVGIVTQRDMARCLGWPDREVGIADVVALHQNPRGWTSCPTAKTEWGIAPLVSFTDPSSSSTGRSMLLSLFALGARKPLAQLNSADVSRPDVLEYVRNFQRAVNHYVPDTVILSSKMYLGPRYGHLFFVTEDNLVKLYQGKLAVSVLGETKPRPLEQDLVMIFPKEGSVAHRHVAGLVQAPWVSPEQGEAAREWVSYLRNEAQQQVFMENGFRPATNVAYAPPAGSRYIPDPDSPKLVVESDKTEAQVAKEIVDSWGQVKKPGVVTFVVDTSGSMSGAKIEQAKLGMLRALDNISANNLVGFLTFSNEINARVPIGPIQDNRYTIKDAVDRMRASGETALYEAVKAGVAMTDGAASDPDSIRGVVVLTDGQANRGARLDTLLKMTSTHEKPVTLCEGFEKSPTATCHDEDGDAVDKAHLIGIDLAGETQHPILVFYVGLGADADLDVGRLLAEATHGVYRGATDKDLAAVLETFGQYF